MNKNLTKVSKFLSYVLRHNPKSINMKIDFQGWASVDELIRCATNHKLIITKELIEEVVTTNDKERFKLSDNRKMIRANQGHSLKINLGLESIQPPEVLYHGTASRFLESINNEGLKSGNRHHVHLSNQITTAIKVGQRHGFPVVLKIEAARMYEDGFTFYCSENGVWLVDNVPSKYFDQIST